MAAAKDWKIHVSPVRFRPHSPIGPGPELGPDPELRLGSAEGSALFPLIQRYHGARRRSRWPDLGDPGPCSRRKQDGGSHSTAGASFWAQAMPSEATPTPAFLRRCLCANDGNIQHSSNLAGVPLEVNGDFRIDDTLSPALPNPCTSPVLLIRSAGSGSWFAAGIPRR